MPIVKIQKTPKGQYNITLPKAIVEGLTWRKGEKLEISICGRNKLEIKKYSESVYK